MLDPLANGKCCCEFCDACSYRIIQLKAWIVLLTQINRRHVRETSFEIHFDFTANSLYLLLCNNTRCLCEELDERLVCIDYIVNVFIPE